MSLSIALLNELAGLVIAERDALYDPYAWPPVRFESLPEETRREHRRLGAILSATLYRINVAEYEEQEEMRANGALYPSSRDFYDASRESYDALQLAKTG